MIRGNAELIPPSIVPLGTIAEVKLGKMLDKSKHTTGKKFPYLRNVNVQWGSIDVDDLKEMYFDSDQVDRFGLKPGDVLVCEGGEPGRAAVWTEPKRNIKFQKALHRVRFNKAFEPKLLVYYLEHLAKRGALERRFTGSTIKHFTREAFLQLPVPYFDPTIQKQIVAEIEKQFTCLDAGIAALKRVQAKLKRYRAAVLKAACEGRLVANEADLPTEERREYETASAFLNRVLELRRNKWGVKAKYKEPDPPVVQEIDLPDGWTWATMPQLGELARGKSKHRPRDDKRLYNGPYPFVQTGDIRKSRGRITEFTQTYSEFGLAQSRLWPTGTLCITIAANIAETGILQFDSCFPDSVVGFLHAGDSATTRFVECFIRTAKDKLERFAPATAQKNINLDVLQQVAIPLPPLAEQKRIVAEVEGRLSVVEELESVVLANLQRGNRLKQSILQRAFRTSPEASI